MFQNLCASASTPPLQAVQRDMAMPLAAHQSAVYMHGALFQRIDAVFGARDAAAELDPAASEQEVLERVKGDHPATFDEALAEYQDVMARAKAFVEAEGLATIPDDAPLDVVATPDYLRRMTPFAAYFSPAAFDRPRRGIYIVTPSVDDDPGAAYVEQVRYGMFVRMALIMKLLGAQEPA